HAAQMQDKEALRASEATLHSFFDSAAVMMGIVELIDDDILHIADNAVARRFLNIPADISYPYCASASGVPLEHIRLWRTQYVACARSGTPVVFEYAHTTMDGPRILAVSVSLIAKSTDAPQRFAYLAEDVTERKQTEIDLRAAHDHYAFQSSHDQLTSILNRRAITDHIDAELARANRGSYPLSLALLDIDHFKAVNDQYGHLVGDHALIHIAQILTQTVRPFDWVGRWGGEEFLVVLSSTGLDDACIIAERLRAQIEANPLRRPDETELHLTVSIGVASTGLSLESAGDPKQLFCHADDALYTAKRNGRNQIRVAMTNADPL
ncbi:MAG: GGDEF domain-containing protein, partial [Chloroflexales bacterium]